METQDQKKILATDNHGVHLCHKCGWPFPNPHPSARLRRAHRKVCGKIDGHKQIDSEASTHSTFSDDEHVSDDDNINPTPKMVETSKTEKGADKLEEKLKRSEDDLLGDAAAEFSDGKLAGKSENSAEFKKCEISDLVQLPSTSIDESLFHHPEGASCTMDLSGAGAEDAPSLQSISISKDIIIDRKKGSTGDLYPIGSEPYEDIISGKYVISAEENVDSDSNVVVETIQPKLKIEETIQRASEDSRSNVVAVETIQQEMKIKEAIERALDPSAFAQTQIPLEVAAKSCSSENLLENKDGGEGPAEENNSNVHVLSVLVYPNHSEALPKDFEDNSGLKLEQLASTDSISVVEFGEDEIKAKNEGSEEEQEFKDVPSNVSSLISAIEDPPDEGVNPIDESDTTDSSMEDCKETLQTKLEEIKGIGEEHLPKVAESIRELQAVSDKDDGSYRELPETDRKYTDSVSNSSANGIKTNTQCGSVEHENLKQNLGLVYNESMEDKILKEGVADSETLQVEGNDNVIKPHVIDVSADSSSQTDSLEGNWGSVISVFSTRSDVQAVVESEVVPPTNKQAPAESEKYGWKTPKALSRNSDKSDLFEPPSFMTLVEPRRVGGQNLADSEIQNVQTAKPTTLQAGWFPSFTPVSRDSDGRKKNEEIIAKVTNWSTGKEQHTALKNLLGQATMEGRPKSPKAETAPPTIRKDEKTMADSILARDSPARLPLEIREKKKVKGKPYWAQFVCCTSANY